MVSLGWQARRSTKEERAVSPPTSRRLRDPLPRGFSAQASARLPSARFERNHLRLTDLRLSSDVDLTQETGRHIPVLPLVGDDRHRLLIIAGQHACYRRLPLWVEGHAVANLELQHVRVRTHLLQEPQPLDNAMIQSNQFGFGEVVKVDLHRCAPSGAGPSCSGLLLMSAACW